MQLSVVSSTAANQDEFDEYMMGIYSQDDEDLTGSSMKNELDIYLRDGCEKTVDPLQWWQDRQAVFSILSRMARNFLAIPGTCIPIHFDF